MEGTSLAISWYTKSSTARRPASTEASAKIEAMVVSSTAAAPPPLRRDDGPCACAYHIFYVCIYMYVYICYPPPRYPGLGLVQMCFDRGSRQEEQLRFAHWEARERKFASLKKDALDVTHALFQWLFHTKFNSHIFPHKPCLLSKALPQIIHISSHTNHALFQRLFHRKFTHPLTQHMSFCMSSFNETKAAYVKELPRKVNPV